MLIPKRIFVAVAVLMAVVLAVPVSADEFTDALALLKRRMAGHWSGQLTGTDNTGQRFEDEDAFTYVVTSEDGLNSATWSTGSGGKRCMGARARAASRRRQRDGNARALHAG